MNIPDPSRVTDALIEALTTTCERPFGDAEAPPDDTGDTLATPSYPYGVVELVPGGAIDGDTSQPAGMADLVYQVTAVGQTRKQAERLLGRAHTNLLAVDPEGGWAMPIDAAGHDTVTRGVDTLGGTTREGPLFNAVARYKLSVHRSS